MGDQQRVGNVHQHVQRLPDRGREVAQPEIVAGGGHQKKNEQREEAQQLEGKVSEAQEIPVSGEQADEGVHIPEGVTLRGSFACVPSHTGMRDHDQPKPGDDGTLLLVTAGRGNEASRGWRARPCPRNSAGTWEGAE